jgi:ribosomal-protein-alanine N-acetyltransferase
VSVRVGVLGDLNGIVRLEERAVGAPWWGERVYREALEDQEFRRVFVWEDGGEVAGFAVGAVVSGEGELESVAVAEAMRRRGVGRALCAAVIDWCEERGAEVVRLEVRASSAWAIALYAGLGFRRVGLRRGYYRGPVEDAVLMERRQKGV